MAEPEYEIGEFIFVETCGACPEQYDVFFNDKAIGYVRLRHGLLTVRVPNSQGKSIFQVKFDEEWKGNFENQDEREFYFRKIVEILELWT
jgi:hypothetical protein